MRLRDSLLDDPWPSCGGPWIDAPLVVTSSWANMMREVGLAPYATENSRTHSYPGSYLAPRWACELAELSPLVHKRDKARARAKPLRSAIVVAAEKMRDDPEVSAAFESLLRMGVGRDVMMAWLRSLA